ncbi:glycosyltransferase family 2 protein [Peribacillus acanthi]|uniref:glycosyltransferase family 2 protein n=1 Tax=Peribacillus acanthi TaxID=2171554 RepID=UPI000D3E98CC|nr:glycosyltransferase family 2 protein [Peribacillus acanthi]
MKISGCVIAKNEEQFIENCLDSLKKVCDEIIFVDTGSTDRTIEIAKELGVQIYHYKWIDNFSAAKNYAISKAKGEWIIFLDADEYLVDTRKEVYSELALNSKNYDSILCEIINVDEHNDIQSSHIGNRFFRKDNFIKFEGMIHEDLRKKGDLLKSINGSNYMKIIHKGYSREQIQNKNKFERNLKLLLKQLDKDPENPAIYYYIADTYGLEKDFEKQYEYCKKSISKGQINQLGFAELPYILLIQSMIDSKSFASSIQFEINKAIKIFPESPVFRYFDGLIKFNEKRYHLSLESLLLSQMLNETYDYFSVDYMKNYSVSIYRMIGYIYEIQSKKMDAVSMYTKCLNIDKKQKDVLQHLLKLLSDVSEVEIIQFLNRIYSSNKEEDIEFLIEALSSLNNGILLSYFQKKLFDLTGEGNNAILLSLLFNNEHNKAYEISFDLYKETYRHDLAILMVYSSMLTKDEGKYKKIRGIVSPTLFRIINSIQKNEELYEEDLADYLKLLNYSNIFGDSEATNMLLGLSRNFIIDINEKIGEVFYLHQKYKAAIKFFENALFNTLYSRKGQLYKKIGISYYHEKEYLGARDNLIKSIEHGVLENEIFEYLIVVYTKIEEEFRDKIKDLFESLPESKYLLEIIGSVENA